MTSERIPLCIYQDAIVSTGPEGDSFHVPNNPTLTRITRNTNFEALKRLVHRTLNLQQNQEVSQIIYRMPYGSNPVRFFPVNVTDDDGMETMIDCHVQSAGSLNLQIIEICVCTSSVQEEATTDDYIPEVAVDLGFSAPQECGTSQNLFPDEANEGVMRLAEDLINMPTASPHDDIAEEEEYDTLIGNDIEDIPRGFDYANEEPNHDDVGGTSVESVEPISYFAPTSAQSEINIYAMLPGEDDSTHEFDSWTNESDLEKGLVFPNKQSLKEAIKIYSMRRHQTYKVSRSSENYFEAKCVNSDDGCPWRVRACFKASLEMWAITKYDGNHTCTSSSLSTDHEKLDSDLIAECVVGMVSQSPDIAISQVIQRVLDEHKFTVSYKKAWSGKQKAVAKVYGDWEASYDTLRRWMAAVQRFLPGTVISFQTKPIEGDDSSVHFHRLFWSFKPCIDAWAHLKPMVQVDGTWLYGKYRHTLLIATGQDGNRNILPLAFAIVESETEEAWAWFLYRLRRDVVKDREGVCLISDRAAGCLAAVEDEAIGWQPPRGYHVYCLRHLASNLNAKFHNKALKKLFTKAGYEFEQHAVEKRLSTIRSLNSEVGRWIDEIPREKWCRAYDGGRRYGHMTTNLAECINSVLKGVRCLPITSLVQATLYKLARYFSERHQKVAAQIAAGHVYCEEYRTHHSKNVAKASCCKITFQNLEAATFEVEEAYDHRTRKPGRRCKVFLRERYCDCGEFQSLKLPCCHALAVCGEFSHGYDVYIDPVFRLDNLLAAYSSPWHPIGGEQYWPNVNGLSLKPDPKAIRPPGRPRSKRIHNEMDWQELGQRPRCGLCRNEGHTRRTCPHKRQVAP